MERFSQVDGRVLLRAIVGIGGSVVALFLYILGSSEE